MFLYYLDFLCFCCNRRSMLFHSNHLEQKQQQNENPEKVLQYIKCWYKTVAVISLCWEAFSHIKVPQRRPNTLCRGIKHSITFLNCKVNQSIKWLMVTALKSTEHADLYDDKQPCCYHIQHTVVMVTTCSPPCRERMIHSYANANKNITHDLHAQRS